MMRPYILPLALLFIAFTDPSIAQSGDTATTAAAGPDAAFSGPGVAGAGPDDDDVPRILVLFELHRPLQLNCSLADSSAAVSQYQWSKNGSAVPGLGTPKGPVLEENGAKLTFKRALEDDYGNYTCSVGGAVAQAWQVHAQPIARVPANTNVVEGQKFSITCKLIGKPYPAVAWTFSPAAGGGNATEVDTASPEARFRVRASPAGVPRGVLEGTAATPADAGEYACLPPGGTPAVTTLRVKDVYAALWPFLGICLEVFILCAIILVYEKRRTKSEPEDSDADTHDQKKS